MKKRSYAIRIVGVRDGESFETPKDEKWRLVGVSSGYLVFIVWKISDTEVAGIVWGCG
jgi:hypothetical protein